MPEVSIIIPVYNTSKYLPQCIESILGQTFADFEAIFIDDGSTDQSLNILHQYAKKDKRIKVLSQKNSFAGVARNKGLKVAKGKYLYFMDSDDWLQPHALWELTKGANKTNADILTFNCHYISQKGKVRLKTYDNVSTPFRLTSSPWTKFFKASLIKDNNIMFDTVRTCNDVLFTYHAAVKAQKIKHINKCLYNYRKNAIGAISRTRGNYTSCIFQTLNNLKQILIRENLYTRYEKSFLKCAKSFLKAEVKISQQRPIVSLTSFPARIKTVDQVIKSLLSQTLKPEKVVLWLSPEEFPQKERNLPKALLELKSKGLEIGWTLDLKSYKKLIPSLKAFPGNPIVTADDDILYPCDWLEKLWKTYLEYPECIIAHRIHQFKFSNKGKPAPYNSWAQKICCRTPLYQNFLTGVGGVLYPPYSLHTDVLNEDLFTKLCPKQDDIWFWAMALLNRTRIKQTFQPIDDLEEIKNSQIFRLSAENCDLNFNDKALKAVFEKYQDLALLLQTEKIPLKEKLHNILKHIFSIRWGGVKKSLKKQRIVIKVFGIKISFHKNYTKHINFLI